MQIAFCNGSYEDMAGALRSCLFLFAWLAPSLVLEIALYLSLSRSWAGMVKFGQVSQVCPPHYLSFTFSRNNPHLLLQYYDRKKSLNYKFLYLIPLHLGSPISGCHHFMLLHIFFRMNQILSILVVYSKFLKKSHQHDIAFFFYYRTSYGDLECCPNPRSFIYRRI